MIRNKKGAWEPHPQGQKTEKMIAIEKMLGRTLEEDYREYYLEGDFGQTKLANRWGVDRHQIFGIGKNRRRNWIQILNLPNKNSRPIVTIKDSCEICQNDDVPLEKAHWISAANRGSRKFYNILNLCPNCHTKLDSGNKDIVNKAQTLLFYRSVRKLIDKHQHSFEEKKELLVIAKQILNRSL